MGGVIRTCNGDTTLVKYRGIVSNSILLAVNLMGHYTYTNACSLLLPVFLLPASVSRTPGLLQRQLNTFLFWAAYD